MWYPITLQKSAEIKKGDLLSHRLPLHKSSLVYDVVDIEEDGTLFLVSKPLNIIESVTDLVAGKNIKPAELVEENWWYFVEE